MTQPRQSSEYGVPFLGNAIPIGDPRTAASFGQANRAWDDTAQMTRVAHRAWVMFNTVSADGVIVPSAGKSQMGVANTNLPSVDRFGVGTYVIGYPASWTDGAGTDGSGTGQLESIVLVAAMGQLQSSTTYGRVQCTAGGQVISATVLSNNSGVETPSDLTGGIPQPPQSGGMAITGAADNGGGFVRLTVAGPLSQWNGTISVVISAVGGTVEANGTHNAFWIDSTHLDLPTVPFVHAYSASSGLITTPGTTIFVICWS